MSSIVNLGLYLSETKRWLPVKQPSCVPVVVELVKVGHRKLKFTR
jgi:hypothetical protein